MKSLILIVLLTSSPLVAHARDIDYSDREGVGGSARPTQGENKAIRMVSETVVLTAFPKEYTTQADFVFSNETGLTQSVEMSFPEGNLGNVDYDQTKTGFKAFKTVVDGVPFTAKRIVLPQKDDSEFQVYWEKTLSFTPHQKRHVHVEFASPYGETAHWGMGHMLSYYFSGQNWRGRIAKSVLQICVTQRGLWRVVANDNTPNPLTFQTKKSPQGATFYHNWRNWEGQAQLKIGLEQVTPLWREDTAGDDDGTDTPRALRVADALAAREVRIGPKLPDPEPGHSVSAFTLNGVFYASVFHLSRRLEEWEAHSTPRLSSQTSISALTGFDWLVGKMHVYGKKGETSVTLNGTSLALGASIIARPKEGWYDLYVPLIPLAHALGWKVTMQGERLFTLERGNWKG